MSRFAKSLRGVAPYLTAGDGGLEETLRALHAVEAAGACAVELGVPFSDPIADGPRLQEAAQRALDAGTTLDGILQMLARFRAAGGRVPVAIMSYANPLRRHGWSLTAQRCATAGADAWIVPDLPVEEAEEMRAAAAAQGLGTVFFVAPTSGDLRAAASCAASTAFVYVLGRVGVTGRATAFDSSVTAFMDRVGALARTPVAVGFGISAPEDVRIATAHADVAIVGTALVQRLHEARTAGRDAAVAAHQFVHGLVSAVTVPSRPQR